MSEIERHLLFSRFRKQERIKDDAAQRLLAGEEAGITTAENVAYLEILSGYLEALDLDSKLGHIQSNIDGIISEIPPVEGQRKNVGLDVWSLDIAVPGETTQASGMRAIAGKAIRVIHRSPDMNPAHHFLAGTLPPFAILLYQPTQDVVDTSHGREIVEFASPRLFVGTLFAEVSSGIGIDTAINAKSNAEDQHNLKAGLAYGRAVTHYARTGNKDESQALEQQKPFEWNQTITELEDPDVLKRHFGIRRIEREFGRVFKRKITTIDRGLLGLWSQVFFPEAVETSKSQIDTELWKFLRSHPLMEPLLEAMPEGIEG